MLADAPSLWPKKLMSSLFARPTQRHAIMPGQPCHGRDSTSSSRRCAVVEMWVFILACMLETPFGQPLLRAPRRGRKQKLAMAKVVGELEGKRKAVGGPCVVRGVGARAGGLPRARGRGCLLASILLAASHGFLNLRTGA